MWIIQSILTTTKSITKQKEGYMIYIGPIDPYLGGDAIQIGKNLWGTRCNEPHRF